MYQCLPSFILGFHGCDKSIGKTILSGKSDQRISKNDYDWLGHGLYFWENDLQRATEWANEQKSQGKIREPFVIGAVIDLGRCLNLIQSDTLNALKVAYGRFVEVCENSNTKIPKNITVPSSSDKLIRRLDCAVVQTLHEMVGVSHYDSVRGVFFEGNDLYPDAGFKEKNHIQICVRNRNCIKGYFRPREKCNNPFCDL